jgi:hypothetical protein
MKTLKITTHWTAEEAACVYEMLDLLKSAVWETYGNDISNVYIDITREQNEESEQFNDELNF